MGCCAPAISSSTAPSPTAARAASRPPWVRWALSVSRWTSEGPPQVSGLTPEEIWISEAQERMVFAVPAENLEEFIAVFESEEVEASAIGTYTDTGRLVLRYEGEVVGDMSMHFLHEGTPRPTRRAEWIAPDHADPGCPGPGDTATFEGRRSPGTRRCSPSLVGRTSRARSGSSASTTMRCR